MVKWTFCLKANDLHLSIRFNLNSFQIVLLLFFFWIIGESYVISKSKLQMINLWLISIKWFSINISNMIDINYPHYLVVD